MMRCACAMAALMRLPALMALPVLILLAVLIPVPVLAQGPGASWDWQLSPPFDLNVDVQVIDLDPDPVDADQIAALKARGVFTICYVSVGTFEDWRDDVAAFPASVVGRDYPEWEGEFFLDIRDTGILLPLMQARFKACADKGFDAVEPDNMDVYINDSGFDISAADTIRYVTALSDMAHALDLQIGQKNVPELTDQLEPLLDFVITEGCFADDWCDQVGRYAENGKPIFAAEYETADADRPALCLSARQSGMSLIFKSYDLDASGARCP